MGYVGIGVEDFITTSRIGYVGIGVEDFIPTSRVGYVGIGVEDLISTARVGYVGIGIDDILSSGFAVSGIDSDGRLRKYGPSDRMVARDGTVLVGRSSFSTTAYPYGDAVDALGRKIPIFERIVDSADTSLLDNTGRTNNVVLLVMTTTGQIRMAEATDEMLASDGTSLF